MHGITYNHRTQKGYVPHNEVDNTVPLANADSAWRNASRPIPSDVRHASMILAALALDSQIATSALHTKSALIMAHGTLMTVH